MHSKTTLLAGALAGVALASACGSASSGGTTGDRAPVIGSFTVPTAATVGVSVAVSATATDADGDAIAYAWTVAPSGCGTFVNAAAATTTFNPAQAGSCTIALTVTANGLTDTASRAVTVRAVDHPPVIGTFSVPSTATVGVGVSVSGAATDADGDAIAYAWTVAPTACGTFASRTARSTTFNPAQAGSCTITLTVTANGLTDTDSGAVTVSPGADRAPVIDTFSVPGTAVNGTAASVSVTAHDPDGDTLSYAWSASPSGCGTFGNVAAASTTFTGVQNGTCTVQVTVTARSLTATRSQAVVVSAPCSGTACAPTHHYGIDPLAQPTNQRNLWPMDSGSRQAILRDLGGAGDLFGIFYAGDAAGATGASWYLLYSTDGGSTFSYLAPTSGSPGPLGNKPAIYYGIAQDTVGYKVHYVWWPYPQTAGRYARAALTRNGSGHIIGWSWEATNVPIPELDASGDGFSGAAKLDIKEVVDGNGAHVLVLAAQHQPAGSGCLQRLVAARTNAGATALAPAAATDWVKLTDGSAGWEVIASYSSSGTACGTGARRALLNESEWLRHHTADYAWAQLPADGSLHFFDGEMYYVDASVGSLGQGEIRRWRFSRSAGSPNWTLDSGANGVVVASTDQYSRATLGSAYATQNYVWLTYGSPSGMHVDRVGTNGTWDTTTVAQPDTRAHAWWWTAISVNPDESRVYAYWEVSDYNAGVTPQWTEKSGYWNGSAWTVTDESSQFWRYAPFKTGIPGSGGGVTSWLPIQLPDGVGVLAYGYQDWNTDLQHYHVHVLR